MDPVTFFVELVKAIGIWFIEFFWFGLAFYGLPLTIFVVGISYSKGFRNWLSNKKGYINILTKLPGVDLRGYRNIRDAALFYLGSISAISLFLFLREYDLTQINIREVLIKGLIGIVILYGIFVENWKFKLQFKNKIDTVAELKRMDPTEFEHLVGRVFRSMGYKVTVTGGTADGGIDVSIRKGFTTGIVQCKRYTDEVGVKYIRELYGTMMHFGVDKGYMVTSGVFTPAAKEFAIGKPITLIDGPALCKWL